MRAVSFSAFGGPEVLEIIDAPVPEPGPGRIRIAVAAAGVNPYDWKLRRGLMGGEPPRRVGLEVAGHVDALGEGVTDVRVGDTVYGFAIGGGAADYTLSAHYARIPAGLDLITAAGLPVALETAFRVLDLVGIGAEGSAGQTLLIHGASGAVGQSAVQIARARGARVIGTGSVANHGRLEALGAEPVAYGEGLLGRVREMTDGRGVDAAVDAAGGGVLGDLVALTGDPARVVTIADFDGAGDHGVTASGQNSAFYGLTAVAELLDRRAYRPPAVEVHPLAEVATAQARSEAGHLGAVKLVLSLD
ncbi:NADP-dependent oxidoreductase [Conexibacter sp. DBS9H8]|uniref:NADP-dependent oxidoreductase n=1 Tax=Conexibacter sp. DBS9H8 TaxID=2937801 RepID=UPI002010B751|nr:NADP-dependent oxidoreductase [Conexibacter sp. DBS9H8]